MSTSGSIVLNETANDLAIDALMLLGVASSDQSPKVSDINVTIRMLNRMLNAWNAQGNILWTKREAILVPQLGQASYDLGSTSTDYCSETVYQTTASANASLGATTISVTSATGFAIDMSIGIQLDTGYAQFSTITNIVGTTITFADPLTSTVTSANGNYVYAIGELITRPLNIYQLRFRNNNASNYDRPVQPYNRNDYFALPTKSNLGPAVAWYYDVQNNPLGKLYIWNASQSVQDTIRFTYQKSMDMIDAANNNLEIPNEWNECVVWNLAARCAPFFGKEEKANAQIIPYAAQMFQELSTWDNENASFYLQVDRYSL
jgi:hypothetical protein